MVTSMIIIAYTLSLEFLAKAHPVKDAKVFKDFGELMKWAY